MATIATIDGVPLFDTRDEAVDWSFQNGLGGDYHSHDAAGTPGGFMGGETHREAILASGGTLPSHLLPIINENEGPVAPPAAPVTSTPPTPPTTPTTTGIY